MRVAIPDPVLTAAILSAFPADGTTREYTLAGLERVTAGQPGTWYVAMVKASSPGGGGADPRPAMRVLLVIDGLASPGASGEPTTIADTDSLWTSRWASGLLLVEGAANAGDAVRDVERMKEAGAKAVAAVSAH